ncbi:uncharacterized protein LOC104884950 [Beta vulgaris subsp. vulgaris]|uniref:uncharacterized protein LOC104884950 n=1 Tax=Beta vulgaris subsp. vulgaris TaxID=3555 RepID=UPI00053FC631|nr:uncharacterized protein LOC104884950 [Beta vulgaris subsp. vulgaris]
MSWSTLRLALFKLWALSVCYIYLYLCAKLLIRFLALQYSILVAGIHVMPEIDVPSHHAESWLVLIGNESSLQSIGDRIATGQHLRMFDALYSCLYIALRCVSCARILDMVSGDKGPVRI